MTRIKLSGGQVAYSVAGEKYLSSKPPRSRHWLRRFFSDDVFCEIEHVGWDQPLPVDVDLSVLEELPYLKTLVLTGAAIDETTMASLGSIPTLRELYLYDTNVTAKGLSLLGPIESLTLCGGHVNDATIMRLDELTTLESVTLVETNITSNGLTSLTRLPRLRSLSLMKDPHIDAGAARTIGAMRGLRELEIIETPVGCSALVQHLSERDELVRLVLWACNISDADMPTIAAITTLQDLNLNASNITDAGLAEVATLANLEHLALKGTRVGDKGVAHLKSLGALKSLDLGQTLITDAACKNLSKIEQLSMLNIRQTAVSDQGLWELRGLANLRHIVVSRIVTQKGIETFETYLKNSREFPGQEVFSVIVSK